MYQYRLGTAKRRDDLHYVIGDVMDIILAALGRTSREYTPHLSRGSPAFGYGTICRQGADEQNHIVYQIKYRTIASAKTAESQMSLRL
jgi:hypothetical protein